MKSRLAHNSLLAVAVSLLVCVSASARQIPQSLESLGSMKQLGGVIGQFTVDPANDTVGVTTKYHIELALSEIPFNTD